MIKETIKQVLVNKGSSGETDADFSMPNSNPQAKLKELIELTSNVLDAFTTALYVYDSDNQKLVLKEFMSLSQNMDAQSTVPCDKGLLGKVANDQEPHLEDFVNGNVPNLPYYKKQEDIKGLMAVPVVHQGLEGVLVVDTKEKYNFTPKQQKLLAGLANQIAWHLCEDKQRGLKKNDHSHKQSDFSNWCRVISSSQSRQSLNERFLKIPHSIIKRDATAVVWFDQNKNYGKIESSEGWENDLSQLVVSPGVGICGTCLSEKILIRQENFQDSKKVLFAKNETLDPMTSVLAVPIVVGDVTRCMVVFASHEAENWEEKDLNNLSLIASFASSTVITAEIKNRCPITNLPNHRFLTTHHANIEDRMNQDGGPFFVISLVLKNLAHLYEQHGAEKADKCLRQLAQKISQFDSSPKHIFKYSDTVIVILLKNVRDLDDSEIQKSLAGFFQNHPLDLEADIGVAPFPQEGRSLIDLIGYSLGSAAHQPEEGP